MSAEREALDRLGVGELPETLVHRLAEEAEGVGDAAAEDDRLRIVGVERQHDQPPDMSAELAPERQRPRIARHGPFVGLLARRAVSDEEAAAAIVFVVTVQVGNTADLARSRVVAAIEPAVDHHAGADARTEGDADDVAVTVRLTEVADAQRKAVAVVVHRDGHAEALLEALLEVHLPPRGDAHDVVDDAARGIDHRGNADADALDLGRHECADERRDMFEDLLFGAIRLAGLGEQPHDPAVDNLTDPHVRSAQIHTYSHLSTAISVILPSLNRA